MESVENQELEYESDPEESKLCLKMMRRREASDEDTDFVGTSEMPIRGVEFRVSDDEGAPGEYNDEGFEEELDGEIEGGNVERVSVSDVKAVALELDEVLGISRVEEGETENDGGVYLEGYHQFGDNVVAESVGGEKKENEPFAVPTAGAFYMHDHRFRESRAGGRHRRTFGGRRLWELKDDKRWGHDKFEEVTMRERSYNEGRRGSRGHNRGHGRGRGEERVYPRVSRTKAFNNKNQNIAPNNNDNTIDNQNNALDKQSNAVNYQKNIPKGERGTGPRRYQPTWKKHESRAEHKQCGKSSERSSHVIVNSGKTSGHTSSADNDSVPATKHVFSGLNSASPPFYPSASSNVEISSGQKIGKQSAPPRRTQQSSVGDGSFSMSQSNTMQGKNGVDFVDMNKLYIDDSRYYSKESLTNSQLQDSELSSVNLSQSLQSRVRGGHQAHMGGMSYQPNATHDQVKGVSTSFQPSNVQRISVQTRDQIALQASSQQFKPSPGGGNQTSYSVEPEEIDSLLESSKSGTTLVGKGKGNIKGHGRDSFPYGGVQVMGASGNITGAIGDQKFSATPTFLPVMQFGGQHPSGMGVPAVGMAFPGYVGNPGSGKSEMTWLPVLAGAAGAMGPSYCNPYLSVDSAYHARPSGQSPPMAASLRENNMLKPGNELKPSQRPELGNDEYGKRQNKSRRYTEMKFDQ